VNKTIRELGSVPDVIGPVVGTFRAALRVAVDQPRPAEDALLADLMLEHELLDRARFLKVLADSADHAPIRRLAERLVTAHTATVDWLTTVLAEQAQGGPAALRPTPLQWVSGTALRAAQLPVRLVTSRINRIADKVERGTAEAREQLTVVPDRARAAARAGRDVITAGAQASARRGEAIARNLQDRETADKLHAVRRETGALAAEELPVPNYPELNAQEAARALRILDDPDAVRAVLRYEQQHADRTTVVSAAHGHLAELAKQAAG
jgi:hypothetical protein